MQFTLIVPPAFEARLGLMIGAGERVVRGKVWRAEIWPGEAPRLLRDGAPIEWAAAPDHARKLAVAVFQAFQAAA